MEAIEYVCHSPFIIQPFMGLPPVLIRKMDVIFIQKRSNDKYDSGGLHCFQNGLYIATVDDESIDKWKECGFIAEPIHKPQTKLKPKSLL